MPKYAAIKSAIEAKMAINENGILDDIKNVKAFHDSSGFDTNKEFIEKTVMVPITIHFFWNGNFDDEGCFWNVEVWNVEDDNEIYKNKCNEFAQEMSKKLNELKDLSNKYADKHNIDHESFFYYCIYGEV